jgi:hypothetical protein
MARQREALSRFDQSSTEYRECFKANDAISRASSRLSSLAAALKAMTWVLAARLAQFASTDERMERPT